MWRARSHSFEANGACEGVSNESMQRPLDADSVEVGVYAGGRREGRSY